MEQMTIKQAIDAGYTMCGYEAEEWHEINKRVSEYWILLKIKG